MTDRCSFCGNRNSQTTEEPDRSVRSNRMPSPRKDRTGNPRRSVKVFRCQLPKNNAFYSVEEPEKCNESDGSQCAGGLGSRAQLCHWCRIWKGKIICSHCGKASYCSETHQESHWRECHKDECCQIQGSSDASAPPDTDKVFAGTAWPEYVMDSEYEGTSSESPYVYGSENSSESSVERGQDELDEMMDQFEDDDDGKCWASFRERYSRGKGQVLRYCENLNAKPLWAASSGSLANFDVPSCIYCNCPLSYKFQVMPQLLHYFHVENEQDSIDWATIVVYTCQDSCDGNVSYKEEFVWVQLHPATRKRETFLE